MISVILAAIFACWGLGLFAQVSRIEAAAISLVPIVGILIGSPIWVCHFGQGSLERARRGAARMLS